MQCSWCNDPHYTVMPVNGTWVKRFDYHSPNCHIILKVGDLVQILEETYRCGSAAGCITAVRFFFFFLNFFYFVFFIIYFIIILFVVEFYTNLITVNRWALL